MKFFRTLSEKFWARLSKLHSRCLEDHFGFLKKREHFHCELVKSGEKNQLTEGNKLQRDKNVNTSFTQMFVESKKFD